jgi:hypothetical protein
MASRYVAWESYSSWSPPQRKISAPVSAGTCVRDRERSNSAIVQYMSMSKTGKGCGRCLHAACHYVEKYRKGCEILAIMWKGVVLYSRMREMHST